MANPFDFSAGATLTAAQLNQIGDYESWTPTLTNITIGNGTVNAHYAQVNEFVHFEIEFIYGFQFTRSLWRYFKLPSSRKRLDKTTEQHNLPSYSCFRQ